MNDLEYRLNKMDFNRDVQRGYTLIELLSMIVVVAIVSILGSLVAKHYGVWAGIAAGFIVAFGFAVIILWSCEASARRRKTQKEPNKMPDDTAHKLADHQH
jgi:hypothetical protein